MSECPKCRGTMHVGTAYVDLWGWRAPIRWVEGEAEKSIWTGLTLWGKNRTDVGSRRCSNCGFLELFAGGAAAADFGGLQLRAENERLKKQISAVLDRVAVLEQIATDPAERTAREIEQLRRLPPADKDREE